MQKFLAIFFLSFAFSLLFISCFTYANQTSMSTYYPSSSGHYTKVHLINQAGGPSTSSFCSTVSNAGTIFADSTTGYMEVCKSDGTVASYPGSCFNRFASCPGGICPSATCPSNYQVTNLSSQNFSVIPGNSVISWSCCFTGQGMTPGAPITKSGCFSIYSNASSGQPASCYSQDHNAYDVGCDTIYSSDMALSGTILKRNCCFNVTSGAYALNTSSTCCVPTACTTTPICGTTIVNTNNCSQACAVSVCPVDTSGACAAGLCACPNSNHCTLGGGECCTAAETECDSGSACCQRTSCLANTICGTSTAATDNCSVACTASVCLTDSSCAGGICACPNTNHCPVGGGECCTAAETECDTTGTCCQRSICTSNTICSTSTVGTDNCGVTCPVGSTCPVDSSCASGTCACPNANHCPIGGGKCCNAAETECNTSNGDCCQPTSCTANSICSTSNAGTDNCGLPCTVASSCGVGGSCASGSCSCPSAYHCGTTCCSGSQTECDGSNNCCQPTSCVGDGSTCGTSAGTDNCGHACNTAPVLPCSCPYNPTYSIAGAGSSVPNTWCIPVGTGTITSASDSANCSDSAPAVNSGGGGIGQTCYPNFVASCATSCASCPFNYFNCPAGFNSSNGTSCQCNPGTAYYGGTCIPCGMNTTYDWATYTCDCNYGGGSSPEPTSYYDPPYDTEPASYDYECCYGGGYFTPGVCRACQTCWADPPYDTIPTGGCC